MAKKKTPIDYVKIIKTIDPIAQTLLFILFFILFDRKGHKEHFAIFLLVRWQMGSHIINAILKFSKKLKYERVFAFLLLIGWYFTNRWVGGHLATHQLKEHIYSVIAGKGEVGIPLYESLLMLTGIIVCFWYFVICIREIQYLWKKRRKN